MSGCHVCALYPKRESTTFQIFSSCVNRIFFCYDCEFVWGGIDTYSLQLGLKCAPNLKCSQSNELGDSTKM